MNNDNRTFQPRPSQPNAAPQIPEYKKWAFFLEDGKVNLLWVQDYARDLAKAIGNKDYKYSTISSNQLRAFYSEILRIKDIESDPTEKLVLLRLLVAKVNYRHTARPSEIPDDFVTFIDKLVSGINDDLDFKLKFACRIFEAVVGYFPKK